MPPCLPIFQRAGTMHWALLALGAGYLFYVFARPDVRVPGLWHVQVPWRPASASLLWIANSLPSLLHTMGFALLLTYVLGGSRRARAMVCAAWGLFECVSELAQQASVQQWTAARAPRLAQWLTDVGLFVGTFDVGDLCAVLVGTLLAIYLSSAMRGKGL